MQEEKRKTSRLHRLGSILILTGAALIAGTLCMNGYAACHNRQQVEAFRRRPAESALQQADHTVTGQATERQLINQQQTNREIAQGEDIAVLSIPAIGCEEMVKQGTARRTLSGALGHMEETAMPGEAGNCVIAGHRNYNFGLFFNRLDEVVIGDEIIVETKENVYTYHVTDILVVEPQQVSVLQETQEASITLITCTPLYIASHRLIVTGTLVEP